MLSYAHGPSETPLLGETIGENFDLAVASYADREAVVVAHQDVRWTYAELAERVDRLARGLIAFGLQPGDRMGIWAPNCSEWLLVQFASAKAGVILVNINPAYRTSELQYALRQSGCRLLVAAQAFKTSSYVQMVEEVAPLCEALERTIFTETPEWDELAAGDESAQLPSGLQFDDPINIQYTSGTTGFPKGATLTHHNILNNAYFIAEKLSYTPADRVCVPVPFYHCFGMVLGNLACTTHGSAIVVPAAAFEPAATLSVTAQERCTSLYGVPTMFIAELELLDSPEFRDLDLTNLRTGIMAGSPCPVEVMRRVVERMHMSEVQIAYGMTETSPVSTQSDASDDLEHRTSTVGRVHPHVEIKVVDPVSGECVPRGEPGELCTRGYSVMLGYWNDPEQTAQAIDRAGWMHTGDLATMDADGYVNIVGRSKDMVIRGGENVYPREIEEFLYGHPEVRDVQVVGVPDERYGEEIAAFVIPRDASRFDGEAVREYCRGQIAHYKVPRYVIAVDEFPMTVTGKIQKFKLRERAIEQLGLEGAISATA
ncbi:MAG TPA: AMP-binding protein [Solirubrobacteraceae bacterium]|nr:AMP-binding protein [Solirubrobacteraceae bacterium]